MARWLPVALLSLLPGMGLWEADVPPASLTGYQNGDSLHQTLLKEIAMAEKHASVHWDGAGKAGTGKISTETGALKDYPYGFASRFGDDRRGTNPEEILGAAHAACFTMAFSFACDSHGIATKSIDTTAAVRLVPQGSGFAIDRIALTLKAAVPGIDDATFQKIANGAKENCPLSKALTGVPEITLVATLVS